MNEEIKNILNNIDFNNNKLIKINNNLYLTNNQIDILKRYKIDYETSNSLRDLMIKIENIKNNIIIKNINMLVIDVFFFFSSGNGDIDIIFFFNLTIIYTPLFYNYIM